MPEEIIGRWKEKILPQWKACFWSAMLVGLIAHVYKLTNWLPNWDSLVFRYDSQNMLKLGRWFLIVAAAPSSYYDLPWLAGLMALVFYGLSAVCICQMFGVQKKITAALIGAAMISFPHVTSVLMYNYVADAYALACLLATLAALLMTRKKPRYLVSAVLIALSVGIYQAYLTLTVMLLLCHLIMGVFEKSEDWKRFCHKVLRLLLTGLLGMALYYGVLTLLLQITDTSLLEYQGLNNTVSLSSINLRGSLYIVKESFFDYFFDFSNGIHVFHVINCLIFAGIFLLYLIDTIHHKVGVLRFARLGFLALCLPVGASLLAFINSGVDYHNLMKMGFFVFYLLFILQYEKMEYASPKYPQIKSWAVFLVTLVLIFNQVVIANVSYHKLNMAYEKSYGVLIRIADRIEQTEGAADCNQILVLGALEGSKAYSAVLPPDITGTTDGWILRADDETVGQSVLCSAINDYCGKNYSFLAGEEKETLLAKIDLQDMENWPASGSVCVVDGVIVLKFGS